METPLYQHRLGYAAVTTLKSYKITQMKAYFSLTEHFYCDSVITLFHSFYNWFPGWKAAVYYWSVAERDEFMHIALILKARDGVHHFCLHFTGQIKSCRYAWVKLSGMYNLPLGGITECAIEWTYGWTEIQSTTIPF